MVKHAGSFAKGFMDSFLAAYKLQMTAELYKARENYYNNKGLGGAKAQSDRELQNVIAGGRDDPSYGGGSGGAGGGAGGSASVASLDPNATSIVAKVLTDRGVQPQVAAGAVAGMMGESGPKLDPTAFNSKDPHGGAGGIAQWNGNRLIGPSGMLAYAKSQGIDVNPNVPTDSKKVPLQVQADYLGHELDGPYNHVLKGLQVTRNGEEGLTNWVNNFEVPADKAGAIAQRRQYIQPVTATLSNPRATATAAATPTKGPNKGKTQVAAADLPAKDATAEESGETQGGGKFVVPGSSEKVDLPPAAAPSATSALGAPLAAPGAQQPNDIASLPRYGTGPADTQDPSGRMIPPAGGAPSMGYPALAPGPANIAPSPAPQATINPDTDKSAINAPLPPERPKDLGKDGDKPAPNAQPVSSSNPPGKSAIPSDPRFTQVTAPNSDPNARNRPQTTALDLSHLWGPNPPVAQRAPQPIQPTPTPAPRPQDDSVPPTPDFTGMTDEMIMGSAKGGPIRRYAQGGAIPSTAFAAAGPVSALYPSYTPNAPAPAPGLQGNALAANEYMNSLPGMTAVDSHNATRGYYTAYGPGSINMPGGTGILANYAKLTPDQKAQYDAMQAGTWQPPAAAPAAAAPAAPAAPAPPPAQPAVVPVANSANPQAVDPVAMQAADPTMTTVTGAPKLPNSIQAKSYDPNVDQQTGAGFANTNNTGGTDYSVGTDDKLKTDPTGTTIYGTDDNNKKNQNTILSAKGGAIPNITQRVNRYDDGGGVSPSPAGMPPGLGGGGGAAGIPPIYYNPATYAGAGAPVGKGISQNSAPTFNAGAIPSLPMAKGGAVAFADGGGVDENEGLNTVASMDMQDARDDASAPATPATPMTSADPGFYINPDAPAPEATPVSAQAPTDHIPPPDPTTPQIKDDAGNPSKGLIGAIGDGLHWLGDHLGLGGGQAPAIARDPTQQDQRQQFVKNDPTGPTYLTHAQAEELNDAADPNHQLQGAYRNIAGLEAGYKWALSRGDDATAGRLAASILHYSVLTSQNLSKQAADALYKGDMQGAVDKMNEASDAVPDGRLVHAQLNPDGTVTVQGKNLNGEVEWQKHGAAATILEHATSLGKSGKLQWDSLESQAAKYDSTYANAVKNRQGNASDAAKETHQQEIWQHQQDLLDAKQAAKDKAAQGAADTESGVLTSMFNPPGNSGPANATVPPTAPALPGPGSRPTEASASQPAAAAPEGTPPVVANAPTSQAAPPPPTADVGSAAPTPPPSGVNPNAPSAGAQTVAEDTGPAVLPNPAKDPRFAQLSSAAQGRALQVYQDSVNQRRTWENQQSSQAREDTRNERLAAAPAIAEKNREDFETQKEQSARQWDLTKPRDPKEVNAAFNTAPNESGVATGKEPTTYMAEAMGLTTTDPKTNVVTPDTAKLNTVFNPDEQNTIGQAMVNGYHYSPGTTAPMIAKAITGAMTDSKYTMVPTRISPDKEYGVPRVSITVTRQGAHTGVTFVLPESDYKNLQGLYQDRQAAQANKPQAPAITAPVPHAQAFPGTTPGGAPSGAFGGATAPYVPAQHPWIERAMGRGQPGVPAFPTPTPGQNTRGLVQ